MSALNRRVAELEQRQPAASLAWERIIAPRHDMTAVEIDALVAAELKARGRPAETPVILRRIARPGAVAHERGRAE